MNTARYKENLEHAFADGLHPDWEDAKRAMADKLLFLVQESYWIKAEGGVGTDGIQWEPTRRKLKYGGLMLIRSGALFQGFKLEVLPDGFRIYNDVEYAGYQFARRPAWSDELPQAWITELLNTAMPFIQSLAKKIAIETFEVVKS